MGSAAVIMITLSAGGSSSAFSSALAATSVPSWGISRSASPTMNTFRFPIAGVSASRLSRRRTDATGWLASPAIGAYNGCSRRAAISSAKASATRSTCFSASPVAVPPRLLSSTGTNQCTSGCCSETTSRHDRHGPHGSWPGASQWISWASHSARRCFPTPRGPASRSACGSFPEAWAPASLVLTLSCPMRGGKGMGGI